MALTLLEAAKQQRDLVVAGIVQIFLKTSSVLEMIRVMTISGRAYPYNREGSLPGVGFRGVNEDYTATMGVLNPLTEALKIMGGKADLDRFLAKTSTSPIDQRTSTIERFAKAIALDFTKYFFDGDSATNARQFDGLNKRLAGGSQEPAPSANGDVLTLGMVDELLDLLHGPASVIFTSKVGRRQIKTLGLTAGGGLLDDDRDSFGRPIIKYSGVPIRLVGEDAEGNEILDADETQGTDAYTHSIYAVMFGETDEEDVQLIASTATPEHEDLGLAGTTAYKDLIEWYVSSAVFHGKAAARRKGLKKALS